MRVGGRFVVDHCVPREVCNFLNREGHEAWTAADAKIEGLADDHLLVYAHNQQAICVTTNTDCANTARRIRTTTIWLRVTEDFALDAMGVALDWLGNHSLPDGHVLKVLKTKPPKVLTPLRW